MKSTRGEYEIQTDGREAQKHKNREQEIRTTDWDEATKHVSGSPSFYMLQSECFPAACEWVDNENSRRMNCEWKFCFLRC